MATVTKTKPGRKTAPAKQSRSTAKAPKKAALRKPATAANSSETEPALKELFLDEIKDIYWAEKKLVKTLPKLMKAATSPQLAAAIGDHLQETENHVARLEQVFSLLGEKAQAKKCDAMEGLAKEGESIIQDTDKGTATRDAGLIMAAQKVEHYEIATYGSLHTLATILGLDNVAKLLATTLEEEKETDSKLTSIAQQGINTKASQEPA